MSEKLLPCPHCGEAEKLKIQEWQGWLMIVCLKCHPHGALGRGMKVDAIEDWNRRPAPKSDAGLVDFQKIREALENCIGAIQSIVHFAPKKDGPAIEALKKTCREAEAALASLPGKEGGGA